MTMQATTGWEDLVVRASPPVVARVDPWRIEQVVVNLIDTPRRVWPAVIGAASTAMTP